MQINRVAKAFLAVICALSVASCTTSQEALNKNPTAVTTSALCRSFTKTADANFHQNLYAELARRSVTPDQCADMVRKENQAIAAGLAIVVVGTAVAVCSNNDCGGGGYTPQYYQGADWDGFYNRYGQVVWACREIATGRFTYDSNCYGKPQNDWRWPGKYV